MTDTDFSKLRLSHAHGVMTIAIDNPPVNVLDVALMSEISRLLLAVRDDPDTRVLVFQSANPAFFIAHVDMTLIDEPHAFDELASNAPEGLNPFQAFGELLRSQPQVTLVKLSGLARGGGAEFVAAADMVFAAREAAGLATVRGLDGHYARRRRDAVPDEPNDSRPRSGSDPGRRPYRCRYRRAVWLD